MLLDGTLLSVPVLVSVHAQEILRVLCVSRGADDATEFRFYWTVVAVSRFYQEASRLCTKHIIES